MLPPRQQSRLTELGSASHDQPGPPSELVEEIAEKEFELGIAGDGDIEARFGLGGVVGEVGPSEVPVELDSLIAVAGEVNGFGSGSGSEEGEA